MCGFGEIDFVFYVEGLGFYSAATDVKVTLHFFAADMAVEAYSCESGYTNVRVRRSVEVSTIRSNYQLPLPPPVFVLVAVCGFLVFFVFTSS